MFLSAKTIVLVRVYNQQLQGTILLMVFDFQAIHISLHMHVYILDLHNKYKFMHETIPYNYIPLYLRSSIRFACVCTCA